MPHMTSTKPGIEIVAGPDTSHDTKLQPSPLSSTQFSLFSGFLLNSKTDGAKFGLWVGSWGTRQCRGCLSNGRVNSMSFDEIAMKRVPLLSSRVSDYNGVIFIKPRRLCGKLNVAD